MSYEELYGPTGAKVDLFNAEMQRIDNDMYVDSSGEEQPLCRFYTLRINDSYYALEFKIFVTEQVKAVVEGVYYRYFPKPL